MQSQIEDRRAALGWLFAQESLIVEAHVDDEWVPASWWKIQGLETEINGQSVNSAEILARLQALPIEAWAYLWDHGDQTLQVGPYAEDFQKAFGGESYKISFLHALGVSMVALQELAGRMDRLEAALGVGIPAEDLMEAS